MALAGKRKRRTMNVKSSSNKRLLILDNHNKVYAQAGQEEKQMNWKRFTYTGFSALFALVLCLVLMLINGGSASLSLAAADQPSAPDTVHLHGQIRDTGGNPRQGFVSVSTYNGPDFAGGPTDPDGFYEFDVPPYDHYVVTAWPVQRVPVGTGEAPVGFVDRWERIDRTTETDLTQDFTVTPGGSILLDAYDPQGNRLFLDSFPQQAYFEMWPLGDPPVTDPLQWVNHQRSLIWGWETISETVKNPAVVMLPSPAAPVAVWGLWTVPEAGTILVEMDNGGLGYSVAEGEAKGVNLAYEFARTQLRKAQEKYDQKTSTGYVFSPDVPLWLAQAQAALEDARVKLEAGDGSGAAVSAYPALTLAIRAKEEIVLEAARQDIQNRRQPVTIWVVGADEQPRAGIQIDYRQINHDFIISANWGGDGVLVGDTPETRHTVGNANIYTGIAKEIGFEHLWYPPGPIWGLVQRSWPEIPYRFDDDVILHKMESLGFRSITNNIWFYNGVAFTYPPYLEGLTYPEVKAAGLDYITTTLSHFRGKIQLYNLVNEPHFANDLHFTQAQMFDFTASMLAAAKAADPQAVRTVVLSEPGLAFFRAPGDNDPGDFSSYHYLQEMLAAGVRPDAVSLQFYSGVYSPAMDLATVSDLLDTFGQEFDVPFFIDELEYPTHEDYPGLVNKSSYWGWHQGHTDQAQADWAVGMYTLAYSKPYLLGANWSLAADIPVEVREEGRTGDGYLHSDGLTPRPMAYALGDLFASWTISGTAQTALNGQAGFSGFAGEYQLTFTGPNGAVQQQTIHVREGMTNIFVIVFDTAQALAINRQDALAALEKAQQTLSWAARLGKTSGVTDAQGYYSQAQAAYTAGQYWDSNAWSVRAWDALAIQVDGDAGDWSGVSPMYVQSDAQGQANNSQLRRFYATLDGSSLVMQFEFDTATPRRDFLFELDVDADGVMDFPVTASPHSGATLFFPAEYVGHPELIFTHLIPSIDVIYGGVVEVRIPLADLGNPDRVEVLQYREILEDGSSPSGEIPSLGVVTGPPWRIRLPLIVRN